MRVSKHGEITETYKTLAKNLESILTQTRAVDKLHQKHNIR
jgi:hypothetical protein